VLAVLALTGSAGAVPDMALHAIIVVGKTGNGEGRITSSPDGIDCGPNCSHAFPSTAEPEDYQPVTLTGKAEPGSAFEGFGECGQDTCTIDPLINGQTYEVNVSFIRVRPAQLQLAVTVAGSGRVASSPGGINCPATCSAAFPTDSTVALSATPTPGWSFVGWGGACSGSGQCTVSMSTPRSVTATFAPPGTTYTLAVAAAGGSVTSNVPGISCGEACVASFGAGVEVTLTPSRPPVAWGGACSGSGPCVVSMARARAVTASIGGAPLARAPLAVSVAGRGTVTSSPAGITCGTTCGVLLPIGTRMTLRAAPAAGWVFAGWSGSCRGVAPSCVVTAKGAASVGSLFVESGTRFPVAVTKVGQGRVTSKPPGINCGSACSRPFPAGSKVRLGAAAKKSWVFARWTGACKGRKRTCKLELDGAKSASATFGRVADPTPPRVTALASSGQLGEAARLRYRVVEAGGRTKETATVYRGAQKLATIVGKPHLVEADALFYFLTWRATVRGKLRFCVASTDPAGNRSKRSCANLHIT
jgi:Divergent InlB B-repeat domain